MEFQIIDDLVEKNLLDKVYGGDKDDLVTWALEMANDMEALYQLTKLEIEEVLIHLARYSFHLQDQSADYFAKMTALQKHINREAVCLAVNLEVDRFIPFEDKKLLAIRSSPELDSLYDFMLQCEVAYNRLSKLHFPINELIKKIELRLNKNEQR